MKSPYDIAKEANEVWNYEAKNFDRMVQYVNNEYRLQDKSHLWPVRGEYNATNRAIERVRTWRSAEDYAKLSALEYCLAIDNAISDIIGSEMCDTTPKNTEGNKSMQQYLPQKIVRFGDNSRINRSDKYVNEYEGRCYNCTHCTQHNKIWHCQYHNISIYNLARSGCRISIETRN